MPPRHVNGFVSRFVAGPRGLQPEVITFGLQSGISPQSLEQVLGGAIVSHAADRLRLAAVVCALLDVPREKTRGLILPAVLLQSEATRSVTHGTEALARAGLGITAAHQFVAGQPIPNAYDRQVLSGIVSSQLARVYDANGDYVLTRVEHSAGSPA